jgi:hypothetical protein
MLHTTAPHNQLLFHVGWQQMNGYVNEWRWRASLAKECVGRSNEQQQHQHLRFRCLLLNSIHSIY